MNTRKVFHHEANNKHRARAREPPVITVRPQCGQSAQEGGSDGELAQLWEKTHAPHSILSLKFDGNVTFDFWPSFLHTLQTPPPAPRAPPPTPPPPSLLSNCALRRIELIGIVPFS